MKKRCLILIHGLLLLVDLAGQSANTTEKWLQTGISVFTPFENNYYNTILLLEGDLRSFYTSGENWSINLSLGVQKINQHRWYQEYVLSGFRVQSEDDLTIDELSNGNFPEPIGGNRQDMVRVNFRCTYGKFFTSTADPKLLPGLGISLDPSYRFLYIAPKTSAGFPLTQHQLGMTFRVIPRLVIPLTDQLQIDVKAPLGLNHLSLEKTRVDNPILNDMERKTVRLQNEFGPFDLQTYLGLNIRL